ncbi:U-scoloptoxin(01)-Cw1a-like [Schistocerca americana]|uniref:U-scoloptoxin(01)-Cw1a-like n=1 Tax=Schistocerca americana TaxID=7009 RepID=UPI001F4FC10F|nr:U-scoloptoxin(01)-Cw1a-like [Schistocerca americana]XP_047104152.1 U-scoloptoxin(01)-Cw1a-like [Schistocerca piceifrons]XP_049952679.1 U-scoloptoxin(01)-Cw1a-like [Schistocerca serialis cubense]
MAQWCSFSAFVLLVSAACLALAQEQGLEYPTYNEVPQGLSFTCNQRGPGYYADVETQCQVWHWCLPSGQQFSFLCPNGTVFNQNFRVCDWFYNVDCPSSTDLYGINDDLYKDKDGNYI